MWSEIIPDPQELLYKNFGDNTGDKIDGFVRHFAAVVHSDIKRAGHLFSIPIDLSSEFNDLSDEEIGFWLGFVAGIPDKLKAFGLFIRPYSTFCRTCLIPDSNIVKMAKSDYEQLRCRLKTIPFMPVDMRPLFEEPYQRIPAKLKTFFIELNYLIPVVLKKFGYEIIRPEETSAISEKFTYRLAKTIHSRYLHEIRKKSFLKTGRSSISELFTAGDPGSDSLHEFDYLSDDIKFSNIDNAYHIPTKLLSIGYKIKPVTSGHTALALHLSRDEIETMAVVEHLRWCWDKRLHGWVPGKVRNNEKKTHPGLVPYEKLAEAEKEKDRELVRLIPALLKDIGYEVFPANPNLIRKLSYAIRPHSSIHNILVETRDLNDKIRRLVNLSPEVEEMVLVRNKKIEDAIREVEGNYNYAQHIQKTYLPDDLFIRECFQESFILYKPKDIVSGDFYFFSKTEDKIIFAAADCTGHGIPAALLSTLGFGIIDQAVNEIRFTDPHLILKHLYSKIHRFLRDDENGTRISDDMDISLCILDIGSNILSYTGVVNPLYRISKGELIEYKAQNSKDICIGADNYQFLSDNIKLSVGDTLYLFSDGYCDQFGGKYHKKYQRNRFKSFLLSLQEYTLPEQGDRLNEEIEKWRDENNEDQTDDIMVIGVRI
ncbi:MAG: SpoIIE family protein phosphatase [Bacteroidales bacterium]|nr:SpoIIE family protein phosphatase [Bacteroidales bacterium]